MDEVIGVCRKCRYAAKGWVGCGMLELDHLWFPCRCTKCEEMINGDLKQGAKCPTCGGETTPYDDPSLIATVGENTESQAWDLILTDGNYVCPKCGAPNFTFGVVATLD
ncbi:MAG TPA: hypothetical protein PLX09_02590 [Xanthomonadaceae bacterium]|nr:hypothetical protein [Xanthomonadaceae bacterium]